MTATDLNPIHEQAARWHARSAAGALSSADEQRLEAWLALDLSHRLAFADVAAAGFALEQARPRQKVAVAARVERRWPAWIAGAVAAPLLLWLLLLAPHVVQDWRSDFHTAPGAPHTQALADGSTLRLDT